MDERYIRVSGCEFAMTEDGEPGVRYYRRGKTSLSGTFGHEVYVLPMYPAPVGDGDAFGAPFGAPEEACVYIPERAIHLFEPVGATARVFENFNAALANARENFLSSFQLMTPQLHHCP